MGSSYEISSIFCILGLFAPTAGFSAQMEMHLCARANVASDSGVRNGSRIVLRQECARKEISLGTVADLAMKREKRSALAVMSCVDKDGFVNNGSETVRFTGVNVQVVSGDGVT